MGVAGRSRSSPARDLFSAHLTHTLLGRGGPSGVELETTSRAAQFAGIVIEHQRALEQRFRESEDRYHTAVVELESLRQEIQKKFSLDDMVAVSPAMLRVIRMAAQVAPTEATVLITGETGTGKEILARAIHSNSARRDGPFIAVNCGALPETLMESELFGHERGAFTGADRRKAGQIDRASGGTLFLDEVGELVPSAQVKLLRVLQERTYERLGGTETLRADVRIMTATNKDLSAEMNEGAFREDLFYRLNVFHIHIPPLRERREAIPLLAERILERIAKSYGGRRSRFPNPPCRLSRSTTGKAMSGSSRMRWNEQPFFAAEASSVRTTCRFRPPRLACGGSQPEMPSWCDWRMASVWNNWNRIWFGTR